MDFKSAFEAWEVSQSRDRVKLSTELDTEKRKSNLKSWLESYPPDFRVIEEKEKNFNVYDVPRRRKNVHRKNMRIESSLDIHGFTSHEAIDHMKNFIDSMIKNGLKVGMIVHGKGLHSRAEPVLRPMVIQFLREHPRVMQFGYADRKRGGKGSTLFLIKNEGN